MRSRPPLSYTRAFNCEHGREKKCTCRCEGKYHNAKRIDASLPALAYAELPPDDPHYVSPGAYHVGQQVIPGTAAAIQSQVARGPVTIKLIGGETITAEPARLLRGKA